MSESSKIPAKDIIKSIYYVIIALAITEALKNTFEIVKTPERFLAGFFLFFGLMGTLVRFVLGAIIHFDKKRDIKIKRKIITDFLFLYFQSGLFYLIAISLNDFPIFLVFFLILLGFDAVWFILLRIIADIKLDKTITQWLLHDLILGAFIITFLVFLKEDSTLEVLFSNIFAMILITATVVDLWINYNYYFQI